MLRTDYLTNKARLDRFEALTDDWRVLLSRLARACRNPLSPLLENNVLFVLADIRRKRFAGYDMSFSDVHGTVKQQDYVRKLEQDIRHWILRLDAFLLDESAPDLGLRGSRKVAKELRDRLDASLAEAALADRKRHFYKMLRTVSAIQEECEKYLARLVACADVDPAVSLLYAHVRNYCEIAGGFNASFSTLPDLYRKEILGEKPRPETADYVYLLVSPNEGEADFTLEQGTAFAVSDDLTYRTLRKETVCRVRCAEARSFSARTGCRGFSPVGWQVESPALVMEDGYRMIDLAMTVKTGASADFPKEGLTVQYSSAEGWCTVEADCCLAGGQLHFNLVLDKDAAAPAPCAGDLHAVDTEYPAIRLLMEPFSPVYAWAKDVSFGGVMLKVSVCGIRNFVLYNDLGAVDTTQPFALFGLQAEKGAWFVFGKDELGLKRLKSASLRGSWQKIPDTRSAFDQQYAGYGVDASSFKVSVEYQEDNQLKQVGAQPLFCFDPDGALSPADISVDFDARHALGGSTSYNKDGYFRVTLQAPEIGFGMEKYRTLFMQVMLENSKSKKPVQDIPEEPALPYLVDVELSYEAEAFASFSAPSDGLRLSRIEEFTARATYPCTGGQWQPLAPAYPADDLQYFAFADAVGETGLRVYLDMVLPESRIPYGVARPGQSVTLAWEFWDGRSWRRLSPEMVVLEETGGLTQSGYVELSFGERVASEWLDPDGHFWLRAAKSGDTEACLSLRNVWTNCVKAVAESGFEAPVPAGTIQKLAVDDARVAQIAQPYASFGGQPKEDDDRQAARLTADFHHRHRAVTLEDYELLLLEECPEVDMVQGFSIARKAPGDPPRVCLVVYSRAEDPRYYLSSPWKLSEMAQTLKQYAPAGVQLQVTNPQYERLPVRCVATLQFNVEDKGKVMADLTKIIDRYFMPWQTDGDFPQSGKSYSCRELYARLVNHEDIQRIVSLEVGDGSGGDVICGREPWSVLLAESEIVLLDPDDGIGGNGIGEDFVIG